MSKSELDNLPYHSWNCITLQTSNRDIDLVIYDEKDMFKVLKYLTFRMETIDGKRGTARPTIEHLMKQVKCTALNVDQIKYGLWKKVC
jgi:hypothetical protein